MLSWPRGPRETDGNWGKCNPNVKKNYRFQKFFELFKSLNIIKNLDNSVEKWNYQKLNETDRISSYIKEKLKNYDFS